MPIVPYNVENENEIFKNPVTCKGNVI